MKLLLMKSERRGLGGMRVGILLICFAGQTNAGQTQSLRGLSLFILWTNFRKENEKVAAAGSVVNKTGRSTLYCLRPPLLKKRRQHE